MMSFDILKLGYTSHLRKVLMSFEAEVERQRAMLQAEKQKEEQEKERLRLQKEKDDLQAIENIKVDSRYTQMLMAIIHPQLEEALRMLSTAQSFSMKFYERFDTRSENHPMGELYLSCDLGKGDFVLRVLWRVESEQEEFRYESPTPRATKTMRKVVSAEPGLALEIMNSYHGTLIPETFFPSIQELLSFLALNMAKRSLGQFGDNLISQTHPPEPWDN